MYDVWVNSNIGGISLSMIACRRDLHMEFSSRIFQKLLDITRSICKKIQLDSRPFSLSYGPVTLLRIELAYASVWKISMIR
jgi:hypothetical protein